MVPKGEPVVWQAVQRLHQLARHGHRKRGVRARYECPCGRRSASESISLTCTLRLLLMLVPLCVEECPAACAEPVALARDAVQGVMATCNTVRGAATSASSAATRSKSAGFAVGQGLDREILGVGSTVAAGEVNLRGDSEWL
jgi:hypothetical protein